jgi:hypothetical protein
MTPPVSPLYYYFVSSTVLNCVSTYSFHIVFRKQRKSGYAKGGPLYCLEPSRTERVYNREWRGYASMEWNVVFCKVMLLERQCIDGCSKG